MIKKIIFFFIRLDGSVPVSTRQELIDEFNLKEEKKIFLLTTTVNIF
jgi:SNF2 family DNA or RNA helicase